MERRVKLKKCGHCSKKFKQYNSTIKWCSPSCGYQLSLSLTMKKKKSDNRKAKVKFNNNDRSYLTANISKNIQLMSRLIDSDLPCLARGNYPNQMHGGHVLSRGGNPECKWNVHNIHRQSAQSNTFHSDDRLMTEGLKNEYGIDYLEFVLSLKGKPVIKHSIPELQEIKEAVNKERLRLEKWIKQQNTPLPLKDRIIVRNKVNKAIGVYDECLCIFE